MWKYRKNNKTYYIAENLEASLVVINKELGYTGTDAELKAFNLSPVEEKEANKERVYSGDEGFEETVSLSKLYEQGGTGIIWIEEVVDLSSQPIR